ncbi:cupin domain-containing protein [Nocardia farcinica]|uniref:cupin domain-containing protein n=1 Tax=Nocardia farcinica TaxID=37329 RepID=UPI00189356D7|nr:cupin domain-containing protein [Nocardia farcinica]MBF6540286.1 cupin domain-containing protein [Nocardia farcinica]MBF6575474.1 cupin domain-containing protein [Nocardia farcinica]
MIPGYEPALRPNPAPATGTASRVLMRLRLGRREVVVRHTVIAPGGSSGWHYHDGTLVVLVARGTLDHPYADGAPVTYRRPRVFREPSGPANCHVARNRGRDPVTLFVLYLNPAGSPLSRSVDPPPGLAP